MAQATSATFSGRVARLRHWSGALFLAIATVLRAQAGEPQPLVVLANIKAITLIDGVPACEPAPNAICMVNWYRYTLDIDNVLAGNGPNTSIEVAKREHGRRLFDPHEPVVIVLTPVATRERRTLLNADYVIDELVRPSYCFPKPLDAYGLDGESTPKATCASYGILVRDAARRHRQPLDDAE